MTQAAEHIIPLDALEALPLPVFALTQHYHLTPLNPAATRLMESGRLFTRAVLSAEQPEGRLLCPLIDEAFTGKRVVRQEVLWPGSAQSLSLWLAPYGDRVVMALDNQTGDQHSEASESAALMAAMLAHEIRNPLLAISGAAQLLAGAGAQPALCELIAREASRIERLLKEMDPLRGARDAERSAINIHELLDHAIASVEASIAPHIRVTRSFDPSLPAILGDKDSLGRAFTNLIKNAAEACLSVAQPEITLTTRYHLAAGSRSVAFDISDNGPGIDDTMAGQLFRPFFTSKQGGRGLGLTIALRIVEDHGGELTLTSRRKGATCFRVLLPTA